jgi:iron complex outermembrane receptor protein
MFITKRSLLAAFAFVASAGASAAENTDPTLLPKIKVEGASEAGDGPVDGYRATRSNTGTRTDTPLQLTPISVQVVSRDVMDDQQVLTLGDAIKNVSGVYTRQGPDGNTADAFNIRGFQVHSYGGSYLDGVKDYSRAPKETAGLERVEVLKGPAAIMYGRIEPGGMINRVAKRPQIDRFTRVIQQFGSDDFLRTTVDSTGALSSDQSWLYRVNVAGEDSDGYKDDTDSKRVYVAPQIEWRPGERTSIRLGAEYLDNDRSWALTYGTIGNADGPVEVPISTNLQDEDDRYQDESLTWQLAWSHAFNESWEVQQRVTYVDRNSVARGSLLSAADAQGNYTRTYWGWEDEQATVASTNIGLIGKLSTGAVKHTLLAGIDYFDEDYDSGGWATGGTPLASNVFNPNRVDAPYDANRSIAVYWYRNENLGAYLQDQVALLDDRLQLLLGMRFDNADSTNRFGANTTIARDDAVTWRAGVLYELRPGVSVYTSYVEGFGSSNGISTSGQKFDPQTSKQIEVGAKFELMAGIGVTVAAFELVKDNLTMADPNDITRTILAGEATSEGIELDVSGRLTDNWNVIASYAYTDVRYTRSDRFQGERLHSVPRNGASFWSTYRFGESGWQIGGGVTYRSERLGVQRGSAPTLYPYMLDAYTLIDAMVGYDFRIADLAVRTQLNFTNATDERYFPSSYGSNQRIAQGAPKNVLASINVGF